MLKRKLPRAIHFSLALFFILTLGSSVSAQTNIYKTLQAPFYDSNSSNQECSVSSSLVGSENAEKAFNFFLQKDLTPVQTAGILGNFQAESTMEPKRVQGGGISTKNPLDGRTGYGLAQWTSLGRQQALENFAKSHNLPVYDLNLQLEFAWKEAEGDIIKNLKTIRSVTTATRYWMESYEHPGVPRLNERIAFAKGFLAKYGSGAVDDTTSDTIDCGSDTGDQVTGSYSFPVARKWYTQNKSWFTKPHHDYPAADIPVPTGTPVFSISSGKVISAPVGGGCGSGVQIDAGGGIVFVYCHGLDGGTVTGVTKGSIVKAGQLIMHSDNSGHSTGPHLHVGIKVNGHDVCPQNLLVGIAEGKVPDIKSLPTSGCTS